MRLRFFFFLKNGVRCVSVGLFPFAYLLKWCVYIYDNMIFSFVRSFVRSCVFDCPCQIFSLSRARFIFPLGLYFFRLFFVPSSSPSLLDLFSGMNFNFFSSPLRCCCCFYVNFVTSKSYYAYLIRCATEFSAYILGWFFFSSFCFEFVVKYRSSELTTTKKWLR